MAFDEAGNKSNKTPDNGSGWYYQTYKIPEQFYPGEYNWIPGRNQTDGWHFCTKKINGDSICTEDGLTAECNGNSGPTYWYTEADLTNYSKLCYSLHYYHYGSNSTSRKGTVEVGVATLSNPDRLLEDTTYGKYGKVLYSSITFNSTYSHSWDRCALKAADGSTNCYYYTKDYTETGCIDVSGLNGKRVIAVADRGDTKADMYKVTLYNMYGVPK